MNDLISRQAAIDILMKEWKAYKDYPYVSHVRHGLEIAIAILENKVPSAQRTGRWIYVEEEYCWCCSSCKTMMAEFETKPVWNYCPNCGAKMEEEDGNQS